MTMEDGEVEWFQPRRRCLLPISGIHVSRSLAKTIRRADFEIRHDTSFETVMRNCLRPDGNWISEEFINLEGWGHCAEVWRGDRLVGGVYGIVIGGIFCAESMFHRETDMSKVALWAIVERCRRSRIEIFDAQIMNPHLASLGAYEISNEEYLKALIRTSKTKTSLSETH